MSFPTLVGEIMHAENAAPFPFREWAIANRFQYPLDAEPLLAQCGSAAELFFARPFTTRPSVVYVSNGDRLMAMSGGLVLDLQVRCANYLIDAVVSNDEMHLAIEIDGMAFHHRTREQVAADYLRERRLVLKGNTVIRFTAQEVFSGPEECWRQVRAIFAARSH